MHESEFLHATLTVEHPPGLYVRGVVAPVAPLDESAQCVLLAVHEDYLVECDGSLGGHLLDLLQKFHPGEELRNDHIMTGE